MNLQVYIFGKMVEETQVVHNESFFDEMKSGWEWSEKAKKKEQLAEYKKAFEEESDKDSFNAQMLKTWIDILSE
ncbi:MAG: hypothetical protein ACTSVV_00550 [Promethearchaeota archaeon]